MGHHKLSITETICGFLLTVNKNGFTTLTATTLKPQTGEVNNIDDLVTCMALLGSRFLALMLKPLDTHQNTAADHVHCH